MKRTATYSILAADAAGWSMARGSLVGPCKVLRNAMGIDSDCSESNFDSSHLSIQVGLAELPERACDPSELTDARDC